MAYYRVAQDAGAIWIRENIATVKMKSGARMNSTRAKRRWKVRLARWYLHFVWEV